MRRTDRTKTDVSRRAVIRGTASLFALGGVGTAAAHDDENGKDGEKGGGGGNPLADADEPTANVTFSDQTFDGNSVTADRLELSHGGYLSIHAYSRFQFNEGEDPDDYDVPEPKELDRPVCESLIGITEFFEPGTYENVEVPLLEPDSPAVELGIEEEGELEKSQPLLAIPHQNNTEPDDFHCPDDPEYDGDPTVDGAFGEGEKDLDTVPVSHDLALAIRASDDDEQKELAERQEDLIRDGILVPQPLNTGSEEEDEAKAEGEDEDEAETAEGKSDHEHGHEHELSEQADDHAHEARKNAPGHDHDR